MNQLDKPWLLLDVGTTKLRARIWQKEKLVSGFEGRFGVLLTAQKGRAAFLEQLRGGCSQALETAGLRYEDLGGMAASGMITSALGLREVPHLPTPCGITELARGSVWVSDLPIPVLLCPGVRNADGEPDFMRGEEAEAMGLGIRDGLFVSTGSHMKYVWIGGGKIQRCRTTIGGEMLAALAEHTILKDSLDGLARELRPEWILKGMNASLTYGLTAAAFDVRKLAMYGTAMEDKPDAEARANYLAGAVMAQDCMAVPSVADDVIVTDGIMAQAFELVWRNMRGGMVQTLSAEKAERLASDGLWRVVEEVVNG